ncbi:hypothetical protein RMSM_01032 [Rhodopirellula maiorica SM1]|uniref:Uncharacterized protein n=1 Tax=Rhodopirellula maiorica SM1 TaxID=1265738 RepID=M5RRY2_9BACT|nr:hypothetical protein RMSM_01032 [Rhodopirellula maiorica SM1]
MPFINRKITQTISPAEVKTGGKRGHHEGTGQPSMENLEGNCCGAFFIIRIQKHRTAC